MERQIGEEGGEAGEAGRGSSWRSDLLIERWKEGKGRGTDPVVPVEGYFYSEEGSHFFDVLEDEMEREAGDPLWVDGCE